MNNTPAPAHPWKCIIWIYWTAHQNRLVSAKVLLQVCIFHWYCCAESHEYPASRDRLLRLVVCIINRSTILGRTRIPCTWVYYICRHSSFGMFIFHPKHPEGLQHPFPTTLPLQCARAVPGQTGVKLLALPCFVLWDLFSSNNSLHLIMLAFQGWMQQHAAESGTEPVLTVLRLILSEKFSPRECDFLR